MPTSMLEVKWISKGRKARCAPDPNYPLGKDVEVFDPDKPHCKVMLPYPAEECGIWYVRCLRCGLTAGITAAGRPDDPRSFTIGCMSGSGAGEEIRPQPSSAR